MLKIITYPDPILSAPCAPVEAFDAQLRQLATGMAEAMYVANGVGLAAPQVGVSKRLIVIDTSAGERASELVTMINPRIVWFSPDLIPGQEGCLSLPGVNLTIVRSGSCDVEYFDLDGVPRSMRCTGLKARIAHHEVEHLSGVTLVDKVGPMARKLVLKNLLAK